LLGGGPVLYGAFDNGTTKWFVGEKGESKETGGCYPSAGIWARKRPFSIMTGKKKLDL